MKRGKKLSASMEDYLEAVAVLQRKNTIARVRDLGRLMHVKNSSVNAAVMTLSRAGLVAHERYGYIELTPEGKRVATDIQRRHDLFVTFLTEILNIDSDIAMVDACKLEHAISPETFKRLAQFIAFVETRPIKVRPAWLKNFDYYVKTGEHRVCALAKKHGKKKNQRISKHER